MTSMLFLLFQPLFEPQFSQINISLTDKSLLLIVNNVQLINCYM